MCKKLDRALKSFSDVRSPRKLVKLEENTYYVVLCLETALMSTALTTPSTRTAIFKAVVKLKTLKCVAGVYTAPSFS
jgi:hypothetical protein